MISRICFAILICISCILPAHAVQHQEPMGTAGYVDWVQMKVVSVGIGVAPPNTTAGQARIMGTRSAIVDARRNLLEVVKGVRIEAQTTMANYIAQDDRIFSQVSGFIQGAQVERTWLNNDGNYQALITLPLTGQFGQTVVAMLGKPQIPAQQQRVAFNNLAPEVAARITNLEQQVEMLTAHLIALEKSMELHGQQLGTLEKDAAIRKQEIAKVQQVMGDQASQLTNAQQRLAGMDTAVIKQADTLANLKQQFDKPTRPKRPGVDVPAYTGLVVDARNLGFTPSLRPELRGSDGTIYPAKTINLDIASAKGHVRYANSVSSAQHLPRVGTLPFTVKAAQTIPGNNGGLMLSDNDTGVLNGVLSQENNFLDNCKVVIVF